MLKKLFLVPLSWLYGIGVDFRNWLYDTKIIKTTEFDIPIVCVGNITVGGTGKTPHVEYLIEKLSDSYNIAVISRGYKRKTKGFLEVTANISSRNVGDEPKQIKLKYPDIPVVVCEDRTHGIQQIRRKFPNVNLVIMDDGMQHRKVETWLNIMLIDHNRLIYNDYLMPNGTLRDRRSNARHAQILVITKCPDNIQPIEMRLILKNLKLLGYQSLYFTKIKAQAPVPVFPESAIPLKKGAHVVAMSGIGNPKNFKDCVSKDYKVIGEIAYDDHHIYKKKDLEDMSNALKKSKNDVYIITTEKDATKLYNSKKIPEKIMERLYYVPIKTEFINYFGEADEAAFKNNVITYVQENHKYTVLN